MLVCPECQFENPVHNRFCQRCGSPLKTLQAVIMQRHRSAVAEEGAPELPVSVEPPAAETIGDLLIKGRFLDESGRYQVWSTVDLSEPIGDDLTLRVIDCNPSEPPPLHDAEATLTQSPAALPDAAQAYLKLQDRFFPTIPQLHAVWQQDAYLILILEDRLTWQDLATDWQTVSEPLEVIHWLYEMTELWEALIPWQSQSSLLNQNNLCVDDDQILCMRRLYRDRPGIHYDLKDLGLLWHALLQKAPDSLPTDLGSLAVEIGSGEIGDLTAVQERLAAIADALQSSEDLLSSTTDLSLDDVMSTASQEEMGSSDASPAISAARANSNFDSTVDDADDDLTLDPSDEDDGDDLLLNLAGEDLDFDAEVADGEESIGDLPTMVLPMKLFRLDEVGRTHVGRQREHNEDAFYAETFLRKIDGLDGPSLKAKGLYLLCDGMGGHAGGEVASALAVETLRSFLTDRWQEDTLPDEDTVREAILQANQAIFEKNEAEGRAGSARMGTTLVMVLLQDNQALVAHVGDSRLYCLTRRGLQQVTVDHEVGQREIQRGVEPAIAYARSDAYQLTQALGPRSDQEVFPSMTQLSVSEDMVLLLCSDGMSDNDVLETHHETHLEPLLRSRQDLDDGVSQLIDLANEHNGHDNITVVAVRLKVRPNLDALKSSKSSGSAGQPDAG
ncbi:MAG: serine/threonine phosphatase [Leptolyngbyaceae cyanobacterium T60_A2020_046]|nr:serine/threonine phosphatase [Leptolyngbyaceae cyanobacterium T60_A2020_046]